VPVIAVGAPAAAYFPDVVGRLHTELVVPESAEVANAVGTVNGRVEERVKVLIKPGETGGYFVYTPRARRIFRDFDEALEHGERIGRSHAEELAEKSGARSISVSINRRDSFGRLSGDPRSDGTPAGVQANIDGSGADDRIFIESVLEITATGSPW
jgi:N-methylhydantoinase A/oxoprolinase/acetone carboxylase beta subunit